MPLLLGNSGADIPGVRNDIVGTWMDRNSWEILANAFWLYDNGGYQAYLSAHRDRAADIGVPLIPHSMQWELNPLFDEVISGSRDQVFRDMGRSLVAQSPQKLYARVYWEFNMVPDPADRIDRAKFIAAWRRAIPLIREGFRANARPGQTIDIVWCPLSDGAPKMEFWPGAEYVDVVSVDAYGSMWSQYTPTADALLTLLRSQLKEITDIGKTYNKPVSMGEWSNWSSKPNDQGNFGSKGRDDFPEYIDLVFDWATNPANNVIYLCYYNISALGTDQVITDTPNSLARYQARATAIQGTEAPVTFPTPAAVTPPGDAYGNAVAASGPAAWYRLNGDLSDMVPGGLAGEPRGDAKFGSAFIPTRLGAQSLDLDGNGDTVAIPDQSKLNITGDISLEVWAQVDAFPGAFVNFLTKNVYGLFCQGSTIGFGELRGPVLQTGKPYHIVGTITGTTGRIYLNGAKVAEGPMGTPAANNEPLYLGSYIGSLDYLDGRLSNAAVYNKALSASDIAAHYDAGVGTTTTTPAASAPSGTYPYTDIPSNADLLAALASNVPETDPHPTLLKRILTALRPIRMLAGRFITPEQYGAVGDGVADDTAALTLAFAALVPGATLYLGPGRVYNHSTVLQAPAGINGYTIGGSGTLFGTNLNTSALKVFGDNVTLQSFTKAKAATLTRVDPYEAQNIVCDGCKNLTINEVMSTGGSGTGFFLTRLNGFRAIRLRVENTLADGIHITGGSQNGIVLDPRIRQAGDDGVACVSYIAGSDGGTVRFIDIINPVVLGSKAGRGITMVGGEDIRAFNITTDNTFAAGVYIASETYGGNSIGAAKRILVSGGTIRRANTNEDPAGVGAPVDHGAVLVSAQVPNATNSDIIIENLDIFDTRPAAPWEVSVMAGGGNNANILIRNITMNGRDGATWFLGAWNGGTNTNITRVEPWVKYTKTQYTTMA